MHGRLLGVHGLRLHLVYIVGLTLTTHCIAHEVAVRLKDIRCTEVGRAF